MVLHNIMLSLYLYFIEGQGDHGQTEICKYQRSIFGQPRPIL